MDLQPRTFLNLSYARFKHVSVHCTQAIKRFLLTSHLPFLTAILLVPVPIQSNNRSRGTNTVYFTSIHGHDQNSNTGLQYKSRADSKEPRLFGQVTVYVRAESTSHFWGVFHGNKINCTHFRVVYIQKKKQLYIHKFCKICFNKNSVNRQS